MKKFLFCIICLLFSMYSFSLPFNSKITEEELEVIKKGDVLVRNINFSKNISLSSEEQDFDSQVSYIYTSAVIGEIKKLKPKYLAEVIQIKPYKGNEDLAEKLETMLLNVPDYAGIPYFSERAQEYFDLYTSAKILSISEKKGLIQSDSDSENIRDLPEENSKFLNVEFDMAPFGIVYEDIRLNKTTDTLYYTAINTNKLRYLDQFDCVWPRKMEICIALFRDGENWVLYGIGGVNAPRIPFFIERIQISFINRINTFCSYIFTKF